MRNFAKASHVYGDMMKIAVRLAAIASLSLSLAMAAQTESVTTMAKEAHPSFEVATIKRSDPDDTDQGAHIRGRRIAFENQRMIDLVSLAYDVHAKQIVNGPEWFDSERWDIEGTTDIEGQPGLKQVAEMLRKLLEDRFALKVHREQREMKIYAMTVAKGGPRLTLTLSKDALPDQAASRSNGQIDMRLTNNSMVDLERSLRFFLERPVVNRTGLEGRYDLTLSWTQDLSPAREVNQPPGLVTAMQEQIGLKLEPTKGMADALLIDQVTKPRAN